MPSGTPGTVLALVRAHFTSLSASLISNVQVAKRAAMEGQHRGLLPVSSPVRAGMCWEPPEAPTPQLLYPGLQWPKMMGGSKQAETGGVHVAGEPAGPGGARGAGTAHQQGWLRSWGP